MSDSVQRSTSMFQGNDETQRQDLSPSLREIDARDPADQYLFWKDCVVNVQPELEEIGGLPLDSVANDVLTRYFDSSHFGLRLVFDTALREQKEKDLKDLTKEGLYIALSANLMFFQVLPEDELETMLCEEENEVFERIAKAVGCPCNCSSFQYTVRRLRIALLLEKFGMTAQKSGNVYHIDYDEHDLFASFKQDHFVHSKSRRMVHHGMDTFHQPTVETQIPVANWPAFMYTGKQYFGGRVHWTHLHAPKTELVLAVGQVWRLPGHELSIMCELPTAQPQISVYNDKEHSTVQFDEHGLNWSYLVMPIVLLDHVSKENLALYRRWAHRVHDPKLRGDLDQQPPSIHVAATHKSLCMMWSTQAANTIVSVETNAAYLGKWTTDTAEHKQSMFSVILDKITCAGCCARRRKSGSDGRGEYQKVPTTDEEAQYSAPVIDENHDKHKCDECGITHKHNGLHCSHDLDDMLNDKSDDFDMAGQKASSESISCIKFEQTFEHVLRTLGHKNSLLRQSGHMLLLTRIVRNRTTDYLDVLEVYSAAIHRLKHLLQHRSTSNKEALVSKVEVLKLELGVLQRLLTPFGEFVIPDLITLAETLRNEYPLVHTNVMDVQNNMRLCMPKCTALIAHCELLAAEYDRVSQGRMNNMLNILTFITFIITPLTIMTGVYGMNFKIIPELAWDRGYTHYFWGLAGALSFIFAMILICLKRE